MNTKLYLHLNISTVIILLCFCPSIIGEKRTTFQCSVSSLEIDNRAKKREKSTITSYSFCINVTGTLVKYSKMLEKSIIASQSATTPAFVPTDNVNEVMSPFLNSPMIPRPGLAGIRHVHFSPTSRLKSTQNRKI